MNGSFDFVTSGDKPALIAFTTPDWLETAKASLQELGYKVHTAATHSDFLLRFSQVQYQVVLIEELFNANNLEENLTLTALQNMTVGLRRHATILLVGDTFQTFTPMEAFKHSVHAVINSSELFLLKQLVEKAVSENSAFLHNFREIQNRVLTGGKNG
jgi:cystathionine beta-lyase/cystathionine gamma-synthase